MEHSKSLTTNSDSATGTDNNEKNETSTNSDNAIDNSKNNEIGMNNKESVSPPSDQCQYELIGESYYYTDKETKVRYRFNQESQTWEEVSSTEDSSHSDINSVTTDKDGRQYYYANEMYLCRDPQGIVYFMDENHEWKPWDDKMKVTEISNTNSKKWHYYKGDDTFYRDNDTNKVYKLNKITNEWEIYTKKKKKKSNSDEEFDTDEEVEGLSSENEENDDSLPAGFKSDPNIKLIGQIYTKHDPNDNMTYEWEPIRKAWFPKIDDDFMATYQLSYGFNPDGTKNENPLKFDDEEDVDCSNNDDSKKLDSDKSDDKQSIEKRKPGWFDMEDSHNTKVYVSNLPSETTQEEFIDFMQKCGMLLKDTDSQKHKIKMYTDSNNVFKGDALCTYIKIESVDLALQILDGYKLGNKEVKVERAKFTLKGDYNPELKPKKRRKKVIDKMQRKQEKMFDWRPDPLRGQRQKHEVVVILRNVFDPVEFDTAAEKILTHKGAIRDQVNTFGLVKKVELFDRHPEGVVKVTFDQVEAADLCVVSLDNRLYLKRRLVAKTWDGTEKFNIEETEEQREERIRKWDEFLEGRLNKK